MEKTYLSIADAEALLDRVRRGERIDWHMYHFPRGVLSGEFRGAHFESVDLVYWSGKGASFIGCNFDGARLEAGNYTDAIFTGCSFTRASLAYSGFERATFEDCNFSGAGLDAFIEDATFKNCCLTGVKGDGHRILGFQLPTYPVTIIDDRMIIGCQDHTQSFWWRACDDTVSLMDTSDNDPVGWWHTWRQFLKNACELYHGNRRNNNPE